MDFERILGVPFFYSSSHSIMLWSVKYILSILCNQSIRYYLGMLFFLFFLLGTSAHIIEYYWVIELQLGPTVKSWPQIYSWDSANLQAVNVSSQQQSREMTSFFFPFLKSWLSERQIELGMLRIFDIQCCTFTAHSRFTLMLRFLGYLFKSGFNSEL